MAPARAPQARKLGPDSLAAGAMTSAALPAEQAAQTTEPANYDDLWARIRAGFALNRLDSPLIEQHEQWFAQNPEFMERMLDRARLYLYYIVEEVDKRGMPMEIALLPAIESAYKPYAYSRAHASGLWQFIPSTGRLYGLKMNWWYDGRRDVIAATRAALDYLQKLNADFEGDWHLALAAYNAGEGRVMRAVEYNRRKGLPTTFPHLTQLKPETKHYVPKLQAMVNLVADPTKYGIKLSEIPNEAYFAKIETDSQIDLSVVARLSGVAMEDLHHINAGYMRYATDPEGPHYLLVPADKKDTVMARLSALPPSERLQWRRHVVQRGDTLYEIARRYGVTVEAIRSANRISGNILRIGQDLKLPLGGGAYAPKGPTVKAAASTGRPILHQVRAGETLWSIAKRYGVLVRDLAEWNLMSPNDVLRLGQKLKIWPRSGPSASLLIGHEAAVRA